MTAIVLEEVTYRAGNAVLLNGISCLLEQGQFTALLGPNGAGKTTLLNILSGQTRPSAGSATLYGKKLWRWKAAELAKIRAVMPQHSSVSFHYTVEEIVALGRYPHRLQPLPNEAAVPALALEAVGIQAYAGRYYNSLSGGEKARVQFARALAQIWQEDAKSNGQSAASVTAPGAPLFPLSSPLSLHLPAHVSPHMPGRFGQKGSAGKSCGLRANWLLLDEPTAALDWKYQLQIMQTARDWCTEKGTGVIAIVHNLNLALRYADRVLVLEEGRLVAAGETEATLTPETVQKVWQVRCEKTHRECGSPYLML